MTAHVNWARLSSRNRMQRQGVEDMEEAARWPTSEYPP